MAFFVLLYPQRMLYLLLHRRPYGKPLVTKLHVIETGFNDVVNHTRDVVKHAHDVVEHTHDVVEHVHGGGGFDDVLKHSRRREVWILDTSSLLTTS